MLTSWLKNCEDAWTDYLTQNIPLSSLHSEFSTFSNLEKFLWHLIVFVLENHPQTSDTCIWCEIKGRGFTL